MQLLNWASSPQFFGMFDIILSERLSHRHCSIPTIVAVSHYVECVPCLRVQCFCHVSHLRLVQNRVTDGS